MSDHPPLSIDGYLFNAWQPNAHRRGLNALVLYLLSKARRGDPEAKAVCDGLQIELKDMNGKLFYPVPENLSAAEAALDDIRKWCSDRPLILERIEQYFREKQANDATHGILR